MPAFSGGEQVLHFLVACKQDGCQAAGGHHRQQLLPLHLHHTPSMFIQAGITLDVALSEQHPAGLEGHHRQQLPLLHLHFATSI